MILLLKLFNVRFKPAVDQFRIHGKKSNNNNNNHKKNTTAKTTKNVNVNMDIICRREYISLWLIYKLVLFIDSFAFPFVL